MLPNIGLPSYELTLPSTNKKIKFRPFRVKEEKVLLIALESKNEKDMRNAVEQLVINCVLDNTFKLNDLASFDLEYLFLHLKARSIGETTENSFSCENIVDEKPCKQLLKIKYNVLDAKVETDPNHNKEIKFSNGLGVVMKYPPLDIFGDNTRNVTLAEEGLNVVSRSIDYIYDANTTYSSKTVPLEEIEAWVESLPNSYFEKIAKFFDTYPTLRLRIDAQCPKCKFQHKLVLEGLESFFD